VIYADSISLRPGGTFPLRPKSCADSNAVVLLAISPLWLTRCLQCSVPHDFVESLGECLFERQRTGAHAGLETPEKRTAGCAKAGWPETQENTIRRLGLGYSASPTVLLPAPRMSHGIADNSAHFASCTLWHLETGSGLGTVEELVWKSHCHKCFPVAALHLDGVVLGKYVLCKTSRVMEGTFYSPL